MKRSGLLILSISFLAVLVTGCSDDTSKPNPPEPPTVVSTEPAEGASDLSLLQPFTVNFSETMDSTSLNRQTVRLGSPDVPIQLYVSSPATSVVVHPDSMLHPDQSMALTINGATNLEGTALDPFTLSVTTGPLDCAHLVDRFEPNELSSTATSLKTDTTYVGLATCQDDIDFFSITLEEARMVYAETSIDFADDEGWQIYWVRADGDDYGTLGTTADTDRFNSFRHTFLPGTYYLQIFGAEEEEIVLYDLRLRTSDPCTDDAHEDNDFRDNPTPIAPGLHEGLIACYLDEDWYSVPILAGQTLTLTMDTHEYSYIRRVSILVPGDSASDTSREVTVTTISASASEDGNASVMCMTWEDGVIYDMNLEVSP